MFYAKCYVRYQQFFGYFHHTERYVQGLHGPHTIACTLDKVIYPHTAVTYQGVLLNVDIFISTLEVYCHHVGITDVRKIKCHDVVGWNHPPHTNTHTYKRISVCFLYNYVVGKVCICSSFF